MNNYFESISVSLVFLVLVLSSCGTDEESVQPVVDTPTIAMSFKTITSVSSISTGGRIAANTLEFTSGSITLTEIQFETETAAGDSVEVNIQQDVVIDFATGAATPNLENLQIAAGTYTSVRVELELLDESNVPSVIIEGTFIDGNEESHPIRFEFNSGETFEVEKEGSITFVAGASIIAQVTFDPARWFAEVTSSMLEEATKNGEGVIIISETSNSDIFDIVADGLDLATEVEIQL
ncbi:MAG: hypothetical protein ACI8QD_002478 [Cyclobacteriaceae bacterium]|jgi:hypothetical protein